MFGRMELAKKESEWILRSRVSGTRKVVSLSCDMRLLNRLCNNQYINWGWCSNGYVVPVLLPLGFMLTRSERNVISLELSFAN